MRRSRSGLRAAGAFAALALACGEQHRAETSAAARTADAPTYLALGDSVAFGLDPHLVPPVPFSCFSCGTFTAAAPPRDGDVFAGYPEYLAPRLGIPAVSAACPGESSTSFGATIRTGQAAICGEFKEQDWLHVGYGRTQQQYALDYLGRHPRVALVTLQLGANDVLDLLGACGADAGCVSAGLGGVVLGVGANVARTLSSIRGAGYRGPIVVAGYFAPTPAFAPLAAALNQGLALATPPSGAAFVDLQPLFGSDPCGAGLLIPVDPLNPSAGCDVHPSPAGARLIADAVASAVGR